MKIITCASFYGCGSSAITDLISEFRDVTSLGEYEFRFLHDIDGISDLEYHLVECPNRHNSGHALKRFERLSKFNAGTFFNPRYEPYFNNQYMNITKQYINNLITNKYKAQWFYDYYDKGKYQYYMIQLTNKILSKLKVNFWRPLKNEYTYETITDREYFIKTTQEYVHSLIEAANKKRSEYFMIDQLLPSSNISRCMQYIKDDLFLFVVDRDPRDLYIMGKYVWVNEHVMPVDNIENFCKWIRFTRKCGSGQEVDNTRVMKLRFEDLVYNYNDTVNQITSFIGLNTNNHINQFKKFNPKRSIVNTRSWEKYSNETENIMYIENNLSEYIYDYNAVRLNYIPGIDCTSFNTF